MNKKLVILVASLLLILVSLSLVSSTPYYNGYYNYDEDQGYDNDNFEDSDYQGYAKDYNSYNYYPSGNYLTGNSYYYTNYEGFENEPQHINSIWGFTSLKSTGYTSDGGYQTTRTFISTNVDYPKPFYNYGGHYGNYNSPYNYNYNSYRPMYSYYFHY